MKILVAIKQVPDTEAKIKIADDEKSFDFLDAKLITNPYDEYALEEALRIKEKHNAEVTVVSVGDEKTKTILQNALALGVQNAVLIKSNNVSDPIAIAKILAEYAKDKNFDIILFGNKSFGGDNSCVGPALAELLGLAQANVITSLVINCDNFTAKRESDAGTEIIQGKLPLVATAQRGLNEPRYASLKGIIAAKKKTIEEIDGIDTDVLTSITKVYLPAVRSNCKIIEGNVNTKVATLLDLLRNETNLL